MSLGLTRRFRYSLALNARGPMFIKAIYVGACASTASDRARPPCDEERSAEARVQKLTDEHTARIDDLLKRKEAEIMEV